MVVRVYLMALVIVQNASVINVQDVINLFLILKHMIQAHADMIQEVEATGKRILIHVSIVISKSLMLCVNGWDFLLKWIQLN